MIDKKVGYYSLNQYLREKFGEKVYKLALSCSNSCPNRDGKLSYGGCIFCSKGGSGDFAAEYNLSVSQQIDNAKMLVKSKTNNNKYIAYFQSYTSTYAPIERLKTMFYDAVQRDDIVALSIATRPDCLGDDVLGLLCEINKIKPVWVELGLQTIHNKTAKLINRGYNLDCFEQAVKNLKNIGAEIITHIIIGLPYETKEDLLETIHYLNNQKINGIKLQLLHILKDTVLYDMYLKGEVKPLEMNEYIDLLLMCISELSTDIVIHRITGDGAKNILVAPLWSGNKRLVLNTISRKIKENNVMQGSNLKEV